MSKEQLEEDIAKLKRMMDYDGNGELTDVEVNHGEADEILLKYVPKELAEAYDNVKKWYA